MEERGATFFANLLSTYGPAVRTKANQLTKLAKLEARYRNHRVYNIKGLTNYLIPKYLRNKPPAGSIEFSLLARKMERRFLRIRIHEVCTKLDGILQSYTAILHRLTDVVSQEHMTILERICNKVAEKQYTLSKTKQQKKFLDLCAKKTTKD